MKDFAELMKTVHATAVEKGWWENPPSTETIICLIHTEISEAFEEFRKWGLDPKRFIYHSTSGMVGSKTYSRKPEGIAVELADVVIRLMDWCEAEGVELRWHNSRSIQARVSEYADFAKTINTLHYFLSDRMVYGGKPSKRACQCVVDWVIALAKHFAIPLEDAVRAKIEYNKTRDHKHGGKRC